MEAKGMEKGLKEVFDIYKKLQQRGLTFIKQPKRMIVISSNGIELINLKKGDKYGQK